MPGQLCELPEPGAGAPVCPGPVLVPGAVLVLGPVLELGAVEVAFEIVDELEVDVAALAIAAPPPTRAPVTARVVSSLRMWFTSFRRLTYETMLVKRRRAVGDP